MIKAVIEFILGIFFSSVAFLLTFRYINGLDKESGNFLLIPAGVLFVVGIILLVVAAKKQEAIMIERNDVKPKTQSGQKVHILQRNNTFVKDWKKTMDQRDRLKLLEMSAPDEK